MLKKPLIIALALTSSIALRAQTTVEFKDIVKLSEDINSDAEEIMPLVSNDGNEFYFVRANFKGNVGGEKTGHDIWKSDRKNQTSFESTNNKLKGLNNSGNNAVVGISSNNNELYVLNAYKKETDTHHGIAMSTKSSGKWGDPEYVEIPGMNHNSDFFGYYVNPTGTVMLISMHGADSKGKEDIYVSTKSGSAWSKPFHLGDNVNSSGFEMSPYLSHDEKRLYFSSDGHGGQGSADIFYCEKLGDDWNNWSDPINLGAEVNSDAFDAYFVEGPDSIGYFSSNRGEINSDIYSITVKISEVLAIVEEPIEEPIEVLEPVEEPVEVAPKAIPTISNIYFDNNRFFIRADAKGELDKLAATMTEMPELKVAIHGHADNTHHSTTNMSLSKNRAKQARKYLIDKGINSSRVSYDSFGENKPDVKCDDCSEAQLQKNRRVEFKLSR
ncbi:MAG: outer membrane protein OmpA-like peptidoglycan-associated protein [Parvicellaceae bacterium]|jgi:outer membrane protein OmpA-like peptidoglycan-associated protein